MLTKVHTGLDRCPGIWWKPAHKAEKIWVAIAFAWCMVLFAMMPLWHWRGGQNPVGCPAQGRAAGLLRAHGGVCQAVQGR